jgi:RHS repeat-associated protein
VDVGASGSIQKLAFEYDPAGNLLRTRSGSPLTIEQEFWYDGNHRLSKSTDSRPPTGSTTIDYAYDNAGNMIRKGMNAFRYGAFVAPGRRALPDAVTTVLFNAYDASANNEPTLDDPCPDYSGEGPGLIQSTDQNLDGIPNVCQCGDNSGDGKLDVVDVNKGFNCPYNPPAWCNFPLCDANNDNTCNVLDPFAINTAVGNGRYFELKCSRRDEGKPVWDAEYTYKYDEDGRATERNWGAGNVKTFTWDNEGRMSATAGISNRYDAAGQRILKDLGDTKQLFVSPEFEVEITNVSAGIGTHQKHIFVMGQRSLTIQQNNIGNVANPAPPTLVETQLRLFGDQLGSQRVVTDSAGAVQQRTVMTPYGETQSMVNGSGAPLSTSLTPFLFTGHRQDPEAGLHYMNARYYDPMIGRFLSTDPELIGPRAGVTFGRIGGDAQHFNAYSYVRGSPTVARDPTGRYEVVLPDGRKFQTKGAASTRISIAARDAAFMGKSSATAGGVRFTFGLAASTSSSSSQGPPILLGPSLKGNAVAEKAVENNQGIVNDLGYQGKTRSITVHQDDEKLDGYGASRGDERPKGATPPAMANSDGTYDVNIYIRSNRFSWFGSIFRSQAVTNSILIGEVFHALYHPRGLPRFDVRVFAAGEIQAHSFELGAADRTGISASPIAGHNHQQHLLDMIQYYSEMLEE